MSFSLNVADIVLSENLPLGGVVTWQVTDAATVGLGWLAGAAEVSDKRCALSHLGFVVGQLEGFACVFQAGRQAAVHGVNHAVFPLFQPIFTLRLAQVEILAKTPPLKGCIPGPLGVSRVKEQGL